MASSGSIGIFIGQSHMSKVSKKSLTDSLREAETHRPDSRDTLPLLSICLQCAFQAVDASHLLVVWSISCRRNIATDETAQ